VYNKYFPHGVLGAEPLPNLKVFYPSVVLFYALT
jgi:hypothetical protein